MPAEDGTDGFGALPSEVCRLILDQTPNGVVVHEVIFDGADRPIDLATLYVNRAYEAQCGLRAADVLGRRIREVVPDLEDAFLEYNAEAVRTGRMVRFQQYAAPLERWFDVSALPCGEARVAVVFTDATGAHQRDRDLDRLARALDQAGESIIVTDADGFIEYVNAAFSDITGYSAEEAVGRTPWVLLTPLEEGDDPQRLPLWHRILGQERWAGRAVKRRKDGRLWHSETSTKALRDEAGRITGYVIVDHDRTEAQQYDESMRRTTKMEAIGRLAGEVAHDFNNLLTVIAGHAELAEDELEADHPALGDLREIAVTVGRATILTRKLLSFSRDAQQVLRAVNLNQVLEGLGQLFERLLSDGIEVVWNLTTELPPIRADADALEQVVMNLVVNARDAIAGRGRIIIETDLVELGEDYTRTHAQVVPGRYVRLAVTDDGCGMDEATRERIFEPFFTTKPEDRGTGLGLATVYGIVAQHEGHIECYSEPGRGTTFKIYLQLADPADESAPVAEVLGELRGGSETVVVVEDDEAVLTVATSTLDRQGYRVYEADSVSMAQRILGRLKAPPDLLVTDLTLGDADGFELALNLRRQWPGLKILCLSGYPVGAARLRWPELTDDIFLPKPFTPSALARKVRAVLDGE